MFFRGYQALGRMERKYLIPGIRGFVSVSNHIRKEAVADGIDGDKIIVATPPAILESVAPAALAEARDENGIKAGDLVFGIFGRIVEWKGQREFLHAAAIVLQRLPHATALIVGDISDGDVEYLDALQAYLRQNGLTDRVRFTGYREDVHTYYSLMDVVVHASITPEPSGRVIFEAMSYGIPVVASCNGGPPEFIDSGVDGYIVDPTDSQLLADRITELLADPELRRTMGARAEQKMATSYNKNVYARAVEDVYRKALSADVDGRRAPSLKSASPR
jgi:glycosyltransferase involved in cell wall biosynthesis